MNGVRNPIPKLSDFTHLEIWALRMLSKQVQTNKTRAESDGTWDGVSWAERNFKGLKGAYAVARYLGVDFDRRIYSGQDLGWDVFFYGVRIEVKHLQRWLAFNDLEHFKAQLAVLVNPIRDSESVNIMGWIDRDSFLERHFVADFGYGPRLCMKPEDLYDIATLEKCIELFLSPSQSEAQISPSAKGTP